MLNYIHNIAKSIRDKISSLGEKGQGMVEYALILAVVAVIAAVVLNTNLKEAITGAFDNASDQITTTTSTINNNNNNNTNNTNNTDNANGDANGGNSGNI